MAQQRARVEAARKKKAAEAAKAKKEQKSTKSRLTPSTAPKRGEAASKTLNNFLKPKPKTGKTSGIGPVKSGAAYGRSLTKGKSLPTDKTQVAKPKSKSKTTSKPKATPKKGTGSFFDGGKGGKYDTGSFFDGGKGGKHDKPSKPSRKDFPAGRGGAAKYSAALRKFNSSKVKPKVTKKYDRRGRPVKSKTNLF